MRLSIDVGGVMRARLIAQLKAAAPALAERWQPVCAQLGLYSPGAGAAPTATEIERVILHALKVLAADISRDAYDDVRGLLVELYTEAGVARVVLRDEHRVTDARQGDA